MPDGEEKRRETTPFVWSESASRAALLLAEDRLTDAAIAKKVGIGTTKLYEWKRHPDFADQVASLTTEFLDRARRSGLARIDRRMEAYSQRHALMMTLVRAKGKRKNVDERFDPALMRELRELEKQIAQEAGQFAEKREISGPGGGPIPITTLEVVIDEELKS